MALKLDNRFIIQGAGRIGCKKESEITYTKDSYPVQLAPQRFLTHLRIGKTVYDVSARFNAAGKQTLLRQFQKLMQS